MMLALIPSAYGQLSIGEKAQQKEILVSINEKGDVHVVHEIRASSQIRTFELINGKVSNMSVLDKDGNEVQYGVSGEEGEPITLFPSKKQTFVAYDLQDVLFLKDGIWTWDFLYLDTTTFSFPDDVDIVFTNKRPIKVDEKNIGCHGCDVLLEYMINEPVIKKQATWEGKNFQVLFRSLIEINSFNFTQSAKSISFDITEANKPITLIIPLELLWSPYAVSINDKNLADHEIFQNSTHAWVSVYPKQTGKITLIGTSVVPEFSALIPLIFGMMMIIILPLRNRINLH